MMIKIKNMKQMIYLTIIMLDIIGIKATIMMMMKTLVSKSIKPIQTTIRT